MKDDEVEDLFAWGWGDAAIAVAILCVFAAVGLLLLRGICYEPA